MKEGEAAPLFLLDDLNGRPWILESLKGKVVLLNFWAPWCKPCRLEMPSLQRVKLMMRNRPDFVILTVLYKTDFQDAFKFIREHDLSLTVLVDKKGLVAKLYGVTAVPETYVIDKSGNLNRKIIGGMSFDSYTFKKYLEKLLRNQR